MARPDQNITKASDTIHRDGGGGLLREDRFMMPANMPCEDCAFCALSVGGRNDQNANLSSRTVAWVMWGILDGHGYESPIPWIRVPTLNQIPLADTPQALP